MTGPKQGQPPDALAPSEEEWRIFLALDQGEADSINEAATTFVSPEKFAVATELLADGSEGAATLMISIAAEAEGDALETADGVYGECRKRARLPDRPATVLAFTRPAVDVPLHDRLQRRAAQHLREGRFDEAVIVAQMGCEVYATAVLRVLLQHQAPDSLVDAVLRRSVTLREPRFRTIFNELVREEIEAADWWNEYDQHVRRRNAIVHDGASVTYDDALRSLTVANAFRDFLAATSGHVLFRNNED